MLYPGLHLMQTFFNIFSLSRAHNIKESVDYNNFSSFRYHLGNQSLQHTLKYKAAAVTLGG
jgi:hypothetical protein